MSKRLLKEYAKRIEGKETNVLVYEYVINDVFGGVYVYDPETEETLMGTIIIDTKRKLIQDDFKQKNNAS